MLSENEKTPEGELRGVISADTNSTSSNSNSEQMTISEKAESLRNDPIYVARLDGWFEGWNKATEILNGFIAQLESDRDRYYRLAFSDSKKFEPGISYADLERLRGNHAHADDYELRHKARLGELVS